MNTRTETERDFDRILFSAPIRRLGDKTQVLPLEKNESVRNRLTHTREVTNLARSVGHHVAQGDLGAKIAKELGNSEAAWSQIRRDIPAMLAAVALPHDLGNPPLSRADSGHRGQLFRIIA